jgi:MFS family permease
VEWFRPEERGTAFGAMFTAPMTGIILSSLIVIPLNQAFGWRWAFRISGSISIVIALVIYKLAKVTEQGARTTEGMFAGFPIVFRNKNVLLTSLVNAKPCCSTLRISFGVD